MIRSAVRAILIDDGKILLNRCRDCENGEYYTLPGGGQNQYETLEEALVRECLEETGYRVKPVSFIAICEEICEDPAVRERYPEYAHKIHHVFFCELAEKMPGLPTETDMMQLSSAWVEISGLSELKVLPVLLGEKLEKLLSARVPMFLGSERVLFGHG